MERNKLFRAVTSLGFVLFVSLSHAQNSGSDVYWHINPNVKTCSMIIDPSLTQAQWHTFTKQVGAISSFKALSPAATLGTLNFHVAVEYGSTPVDQRDPAWINTFAHPDADCPLGDAIAYPAIRVRVGVTDNMDVGGYWTSAPGANYGMVGGELKYRFLQESDSSPTAAVRGSFTVLTGVPDFDLNVYSIDLQAGKRFGMFSPYVGIRTNLVVGTETTSKVDLNTERMIVPQGYAGVAVSIWMVDVAAEYNLSTVNTFALNIGIDF